MPATRDYDVSCDPYDTGARIHFAIRAANAVAARRIARRQAEESGVMAAGWRHVQVERVLADDHIIREACR